MRQRKWLTAAALAACLSSGGAAMAETGGAGPAADAALPGMGLGAPPQGKAVMDMADIQGGYFSHLKGFLKDMPLGEGMSYHALSRDSMTWMGKGESAEPLPFGQIQIRRDGLLMTADVVNLSIPKQEGAPVAAIFERQDNGTLSPAGQARIELFNAMLGSAGSVINGSILDFIAEARREMKDPIPYSFAHVDVRSIEPLHPMSGKRLVYTAGTRVFLYMDGWIFPVYLKGYLYEEGNTYRLIAVIANDSVKDAARAAGEALVKTLTGAK